VALVICGRQVLRQTLIFHSLLGLAVVLAIVDPRSCAAGSTTLPTGENVHSGKGDVAKFGENDGPAQLPRSCYYTGMDGTHRAAFLCG
jgi:hypothetical protein